MFDLIFLGTSASAPSTRRGLPAAIVQHRDYRFLIDCGEGTQRQILRSGLGFKRMDHVLLTHGHLDHILGLGGLASTFGRWEAIPAMEIYGGRRTLQRVHALMRVVFGPSEGSMRIGYHTLVPGILMEDDGFCLRVFEVEHRGAEAFGFLFEEKARRPFLAEQAQELGVPNGPIRRDLVAGKSVVLPDGRVILPDQVLGESTPGARLAFVGDAGEVVDLVPHVFGADLLAIEATYAEEERETARQYGHLTARQAAWLAQTAQVKYLVLHHISRRHSAQQILEEAASIFPQTVVARDFDMYRVVKQKPTERGDVREQLSATEAKPNGPRRQSDYEE